MDRLKLLQECREKDVETCARHLDSFSSSLKHPEKLDFLFSLVGQKRTSGDSPASVKKYMSWVHDGFYELSDEEKVWLFHMAVGRTQLSNIIYASIRSGALRQREEDSSVPPQIQKEWAYLKPDEFEVFPWTKFSDYPLYGSVTPPADAPSIGLKELYTEAHVVDDIPAGVCFGFEDRCVALVEDFLNSLSARHKGLAMRSLIGNLPSIVVQSIYNSFSNEMKLALLKVSWDRDGLYSMISERIEESLSLNSNLVDDEETPSYFSILNWEELTFAPSLYGVASAGGEEMSDLGALLTTAALKPEQQETCPFFSLVNCILCFSFLVFAAFTVRKRLHSKDWGVATAAQP